MDDDVRLKVAGTGSYLPKRIVENREFEGRTFYAYNVFGERTNNGQGLTADNIYELSGIRERRYVAEGETPSSMGTLAAIRAIDRADIEPKSLSGIILATVTEDVNFPSGAAKIQRALGEYYNTEISCEAVDIGAACAGSVGGMIYANSRVLRKRGNYLVVGADDVAGMTQNDDRNKFLFGAGAGAVILAPTTTKGKGIIGEFFVNNPFNKQLGLITRDTKGFLRMPKGGDVLKEAVGSMVRSIVEVKSQVGWNQADVYIAHQANGRILDNMRKRIERIEGEGSFVYRNIEKTGNMSAATCPIALDEAIRKEVVKEGSKVVMTSFGSGLSTAAVAIQF